MYASTFGRKRILFILQEFLSEKEVHSNNKKSIHDGEDFDRKRSRFTEQEVHDGGTFRRKSKSMHRTRSPWKRIFTEKEFHAQYRKSIHHGGIIQQEKKTTHRTRSPCKMERFSIGKEVHSQKKQSIRSICRERSPFIIRFNGAESSDSSRGRSFRRNRGRSHDWIVPPELDWSHHSTKYVITFQSIPCNMIDPTIPPIT